MNGATTDEYGFFELKHDELDEVESTGHKLTKQIASLVLEVVAGTSQSHKTHK